MKEKKKKKTPPERLWDMGNGWLCEEWILLEDHNYAFFVFVFADEIR